MTDDFACQTDRRTKPVVIVGPILDESVNARRTGLIIPRIENLKLCIVMAGESITSVRTPELVESIKDRIVDCIIIIFN